MVIKYDMAEEKIPEMDAHKINKLCENILKVATDNPRLIGEVNKLTPLIDKYVEDITSTDATKTAALVDNLKTEFL